MPIDERQQTKYHAVLRIFEEELVRRRSSQGNSTEHWLLYVSSLFSVLKTYCLIRDSDSVNKLLPELEIALADDDEDGSVRIGVALDVAQVLAEELGDTVRAAAWIEYARIEIARQSARGKEVGSWQYQAKCREIEVAAYSRPPNPIAPRLIEELAQMLPGAQPFRRLLLTAARNLVAAGSRNWRLRLLLETACHDIIRRSTLGESEDLVNLDEIEDLCRRIPRGL